MIGGTHIEVHLGQVIDNVDPERRGRIRVRCDTLAGSETELPDWIEPSFAFLCGDGSVSTGGWFFVPDIGTMVEVEVNTSSPRDETFGLVSFDAPAYHWRGCLIFPSGDSISSEFNTDHYPNRRGITTTAGHALVFDDTQDETEVKLLQQSSPGENTFLMFDKFGGAMLLTNEGHLLYMNNEDLQLSLIDANSNALVMTEAGWYITSAQSDMVKAGDGVISILTGNLVLGASGVAVQLASLDTPVLVEGTAGFSSLLSAALAEISAGILLAGGTNVAILALKTAVDAGAFTSTRLSAE